MARGNATESTETIGSMGRTVYLPTFGGIFLVNVGKYTYHTWMPWVIISDQAPLGIFWLDVI